MIVTFDLICYMLNKTALSKFNKIIRSSFLKKKDFMHFLISF